MEPLVPDREEWFQSQHGFPRPDWDGIEDFILSTVEDRRMDEAWATAAKHWLTRNGIAGELELAESDHFFLLGPFGPDECARMLDVAENAYQRLSSYLEIRANPHYGKIAVFRFVDSLAYYSYVAAFYEAEQPIPESRGIYVNVGLPHLVCFAVEEEEFAPILMHELAHLLAFHLPLPRWVDEGFAMLMAKDKGLDESLAEDFAEHQEFWTRETIKRFWSGELFDEAEDAGRLCYALAARLFDTIQNELQAPAHALRSFLEHASCDDSGASAARKYLRADLGELVEFVLGPGEWRPEGGLKTWRQIG